MGARHEQRAAFAERGARGDASVSTLFTLGIILGLITDCSRFTALRDGTLQLSLPLYCGHALQNHS